MQKQYFQAGFSFFSNFKIVDFKIAFLMFLKNELDYHKI